MPYHDITTFTFSIPNRPAGQAEQDLSELFQNMMNANIKVFAISGFASGRRIKIFCVPEDAEQFRSFLKSAKIRKRERPGFSITGENEISRVIAVLDFIALSGFHIRAFDGLGVEDKAGGFVW